MNFNTMKTMGLMTVLTLLFIGLGSLLGGRGGMMIAFMFAIAMNVFSYWFSDKIVLKMYKAQPVSQNDAPMLYEIVRKLAQRGNIPMPKVYIINNQNPNAFATGRNPEHGVVAVTTGLMEMLTPDEIEGVVAHELGHIYGRDILISTVAATFAGAIMMLADMARWAAIFGSSDDEDNPLGGAAAILLSIIAPIAALVVQMAISRSREYLADERGAHLSGKPRALASALAKISGIGQQIPMDTNPATAHMFIMNPLSGRSMLSLFSTHPPVEERIARLEKLAQKIG